jgi:hypothetical protein
LFSTSNGEKSLRKAFTVLQKEVIVARRRSGLATQTAFPIAALRLAAMAGESPTKMGALLAIALGIEAVESVMDLVELRHDQLSEASLIRLQDAMVEWTGSGDLLRRHAMVESLATEEWIKEWFLTDETTRLSEVGQRLVEEQWAVYDMFRSEYATYGPAFANIAMPDPKGEFAPGDEQARVYRTIRQAMERDATTPWHAVRSLEAPHMHAVIHKNDPEGRLTPALQAFWVSKVELQTQIRTDTNTRAACVVLAVYRHHAATGRWPAALSDIKPEHMPIEPLDPYSGKPFGYTVIDGQPLVWSLGVDQDDDAGRRGGWDGYAPPWMPRDDYDALPEEARAQMDGDWLIFPEAPLSPASSDVQP